MAKPKQTNRYLKNPITGVIFAETPVLKKMRKDLLPCTKTGMLLQRENVDMPHLFNPFTGAILPNSGDNADIAGLIPVRDEAHAAEIKAALMGGNTEKVKLAPPAQKAVTDTDDENGGELAYSDTAAVALPQSTETPAEIEALREIDVYKMDKKQLQDFAKEKFDEKLDGRAGEETMREQVLVMIQNALIEARAA